jgi:hypothetical protein
MRSTPRELPFRAPIERAAHRNGAGRAPTPSRAASWSAWLVVALSGAALGACGGAGDAAVTSHGGTTGTTIGTSTATGHGGSGAGGHGGMGGAATTAASGGQGHGGAGKGGGGQAGHGGAGKGGAGLGGSGGGHGGAGGHGGTTGSAGAGGKGCGAGELDCSGACVTPANDPNNCGQCGNVCPDGSSCVASTCLCPQGQLLCGGACASISNDPQNCGACGVACAGGEQCAGGSCACPLGQTSCGGACVDVGSDPKNCGKCAAACGPKEVCSGGKCSLSCDPGLVPCNGACVSLSGDPQNCGACGTACPGAPNASPTCASGACGTSCQPGFLDCDKSPANGCEVNGQSDPKSCGACGNGCPAAPNASPSCAGGACSFACLSGFADCDKNAADGCEAPLGVDPQNCGGCGTLCPSAPNAIGACAGGLCAIACAPGFADCDGNPANGCEVDLGSDPLSCAACGKACLVLPNSSPVCVAGACGFTCLAGFLDCDGQPNDGCEVESGKDPLNCGACGDVCALANATSGCANGACTVVSCLPGFTDCDGKAADGCETPTAADAANCGGCGYACDAAGVKTKQCAAGVCAPVCVAGKADCNGPAPGNVDDGCEATLATDPLNCGTCGVMCAVGQKCCAGGCQSTSNCALTVTNVSPPVGWRNGGDFLTITGTGFGPGVKVLIDDGVAPAWAKDASTLYVQTPPHPDGVVDVTITMGADTVVLKKGFGYQALGVNPPWQMKPMAKVRGEDPGVTVMANGKVLVTGGTTVPDNAGLTLSTAEIYDRKTDTVVPAGNAMSSPRWHNSAVTLLTGKVLVVGGCSGCAAGNSRAADLFDPATNLFSPAAQTISARNVTRSVLMPDGRVFVSSADSATVELYDPIANTWKQIAHAQLHPRGFVVRLRDGRVMIGSGDGGITVVELFDPATETFTTTGPVATARSMLTAHTLPDGRVIVIGGANVSAGAVNAPQATMETWSPATGKWTYLPVSLKTPRCWHASALIRDGTILVMGGYPITGSCQPTDVVEQVDPVANTVVPFGNLLHANTEWNAVTMLDGSVLAVGGGACGQSSALPDLDFLPGAL